MYPAVSGPCSARTASTVRHRDRAPEGDKHWQDRLVFEDDIRRRYSATASADFDPSYVGEHWDETTDPTAGHRPCQPIRTNQRGHALGCDPFPFGMVTAWI